MKKVVFVLAFVLLFAASSFASGTFSVGATSNSNLDKVGATLLTGVQTAIDASKGMYLRTEFAKVNWGDSVSLDNISVKYITYWPLPIWNEVDKEFKVGVHLAGNYETGDADLGAAFGFELYKQLIPSTLGLYGTVDFLSVQDIKDYFVVGVGITVGP